MKIIFCFNTKNDCDALKARFLSSEEDGLFNGKKSFSSIGFLQSALKLMELRR